MARMYVARLKGGKCPKGSKNHKRKGINRCKRNGR